MKSTIQHIFGFTFTMVTIFLTAACSEYTPEDFDSSNITEDVYDKISEYTQNFTYRYGKMDPEHSWGFGELAPEGSKGMMTRAISPSYNFPDDADASKFLAAVPEGVEKRGSFASGTGYIDESYTGEVNIWGVWDGSKTTGGTLYIRGNNDFTNRSFYVAPNTDIHLLKGATLSLNYAGNLQSGTNIYIAEGATFKTGGDLILNSTIIYNHGTIEASSLNVNNTGLLYNTGTAVITGAILIANSNSVIVNDGTITGANLNTAGSSHIQNNATMTISGQTLINSNNNTWVNNGHYTTGSFDYQAGSSDVINNCHLTVNGEFHINLGDCNSDTGFFMDGGAGVVAKSFKADGPFYIHMGSKSVFEVKETAVFNATKANYGVYGIGADYAVFHANKIEAGTANQGYEVTYGGKLYVVAETTHFANGFSGAYPYIDFKDGCSEANILQNGSVPAITIPASECNPGFNGGGTTPDPEPEPDPTPDPDPMPETVTTETVRVMCEDLGSTNDFDFNDLVFDVYYTYEEDAAGSKTNIQAHITLQAVGGTLPIYIGTDTSDPTKELHYRMTGTYAKNPINVGAGTTCAPVTFTVPATSTDPDDIEICVGNSGNKKTIILPKSGKGKSFAPQKISVPTTVRWLKESQQIEWGYRIFYSWVRNEDLKPLFWEAEIERSYLY